MVVSGLAFYTIKIIWLCMSVPGVAMSTINYTRAVRTENLVVKRGINSMFRMLSEHIVFTERARLMTQVLLGMVGVLGVAAGFDDISKPVDMERFTGSVLIAGAIVSVTANSIRSYLVGLALEAGTRE
jgi:hypothetical protein